MTTPADPHCIATAAYAIRVARRMELSAEDTERLRNAALWHDEGRGVVLEKLFQEIEGIRLEATDPRWMFIRKHPEYGYALYCDRCRQNSMPIDTEIGAGILFHHMDFDGRGYPPFPDLSGYDIPFFGRFMRVIDTATSMAQDRGYLPARSWHEIVAELRAGRGIRYCPEVTDAALAEGMPVV